MPKKGGHPPKRVIEFDDAEVARISEIVYRDRLGGKVEVAKMIKEDGDQGQKLARRARAYDALTRSYMRAIGTIKKGDG